jgi:hypothetical protein
MQRSYPKWEYLAFVEGQPKRGGMPHFHIISSQPPNAQKNAKGNVTKHILHDWAHHLGWGFEIKVEAVTSGQAASYVAKYSTKQHPATPKHFRRVRVSKGWTKLPRDPERKLIVPAHNEDVAHFIARLADISGLSPEHCYQNYTAGRAMLKAAQNDTNVDSGNKTV